MSSKKSGHGYPGPADEPDRKSSRSGRSADKGKKRSSSKPQPAQAARSGYQTDQYSAYDESSRGAEAGSWCGSSTSSATMTAGDEYSYTAGTSQQQQPQYSGYYAAAGYAAPAGAGPGYSVASSSFPSAAHQSRSSQQQQQYQGEYYATSSSAGHGARFAAGHGSSSSQRSAASTSQGYASSSDGTYQQYDEAYTPEYATPRSHRSKHVRGVVDKCDEVLKAPRK